MSDLSNAIPVINAYFPAGLRRCVNVRKVYDFLDMGDSSSHWFKRVVMPMSHCVKGDDYVIVRISSAPIVLENETFYVYDGPRTGIDILCVVEKLIPAVRKTHSSNAYVVANYLTNALTKEEPIKESDYMFDEFCTKPLHRVVVPPQAQEHETQKQEQEQSKEQEKSQIKLFENEQFGSVRFLPKDDSFFVVGKDVLRALGYAESTDPNKAFASVPAEWAERKPILVRSENGTEQTREMLCLSEQGLYFFLGRSDKPTALPYQKWIAGEVVPAIRKTGSYSTKPNVPYALYITDEQGKRHRYTLDK